MEEQIGYYLEGVYRTTLISGLLPAMNTPNYIKILALDKLALKAKSRATYLQKAKSRWHLAKVLGVAASFSYFLEQAWFLYGNGK
jgi:hypothetical protein